jgi:hypothetical protein
MSEEISANIEETLPLPPTRRRLDMSHKCAGADIPPPCQGTRTTGAHARLPALRRFARLISRSLTHDLELRGLGAPQARRRYWRRPEAQFVEGFPNFSANDRADLCGGNVLGKQPHRGNSTLEVGCLPTGSTAVARHWPSAPYLESDLAVRTANSARAPANHASTAARELAMINVSLTNLTNKQGKPVFLA